MWLGFGLELAVSSRAPSPGNLSPRGAQSAAGNCRLTSAFSDTPRGIKAPLPPTPPRPPGPKERLGNESLQLSRSGFGPVPVLDPTPVVNRFPDKVGGRL